MAYSVTLLLMQKGLFNLQLVPDALGHFQLVPFRVNQSSIMQIIMALKRNYLHFGNSSTTTTTTTTTITIMKMMLFNALALLCSISGIHGRGQAPSPDMRFLKDDLSTLQCHPKLEMPSVEVPKFTPGKEPYDPSIETDLGKWSEKATSSSRDKVGFFAKENEAVWSKLIPAARDNKPKPQLTPLKLTILQSQLDRAISGAESNSNPKVIENRIKKVNAEWGKFVEVRSKLENKKAEGLFSKKVIIKPSELAELKSFHDVYRINYNFTKKIIDAFPETAVLLAKYNYIKKWLKNPSEDKKQ